MSQGDLPLLHRDLGATLPGPVRQRLLATIELGAWSGCQVIGPGPERLTWAQVARTALQHARAALEAYAGATEARGPAVRFTRSESEPGDRWVTFKVRAADAERCQARLLEDRP